MNIRIEVIPNAEHRRPFTGADWYFTTEHTLAPAGSGKMSVPIEVLHVKVSNMSDWRREMILAMHEVVEAILCKHNGVTQEQVDDFDKLYQKSHDSDIEAGDAVDAPYRREHCFATAVERMMAAEMDVDWGDYERELDEL